ncbi:ABC transporter ATP-binding protein [Phytoactinopolyspora endophytica]|uniref:ABC transporter ATP-binding protein n=1 Tax=Phytoactinopolyspora endophytica TaxID=1642495 RepID=UPI00101D9468|nr:ABC transporter ATP-binding protein [Phytoactinopolyspora endophytica]
MSRHVPHADPGIPDSRGPVRYLWWLVIRQWTRALRGALWGSLSMCVHIAPPYLTARAIDDGINSGDMATLALWVSAVLAVGVLNAGFGLLRHRTMTFARTDAAYRTVQVVVRQAVRLGATLPRNVSSGEIAAVQTADVGRISQVMTVTGPGVGAVVAYVVVASLLFAISPLLAVVVLLGVPALALLIGPLLGRLRGAETTYREQQGALTARAGDIVSGLRVLFGIGGKAVFAERYRGRSAALRSDGYRVGAITSWVEAVGAGLPIVFVGAVVWLAARQAVDGTITVGEMVAVYGYVAVLVLPVSALIESADDITRGIVSARRVVRILAMSPGIQDGPSTADGPREPADMRDPESQLTVPAGRMSALVSSDAAEAAAIVDRLGRYTESDTTWGDVPLSEMALAEVRSRILVADQDAYLFAGTLRDGVGSGRRDDGSGGSHRDTIVSDSEIDDALHTASADDIVAALRDGLAAPIEAQARNLSGGQQQRIRLARALLAQAEVLLLIEPTSAVDALTEAAIASRLRAARQGRTTLVVGTSPLLLDQADQVSYVVRGTVAAVGTHSELLATEPGYRALVFRGSDEDDLLQGAVR